jgi:hypothetical protein
LQSSAAVIVVEPWFPHDVADASDLPLQTPVPPEVTSKNDDGDAARLAYRVWAG